MGAMARVAIAGQPARTGRMFGWRRGRRPSHDGHRAVHPSLRPRSRRAPQARLPPRSVHSSETKRRSGTPRPVLPDDRADGQPAEPRPPRDRRDHHRHPTPTNDRVRSHDGGTRTTSRGQRVGHSSHGHLSGPEPRLRPRLPSDRGVTANPDGSVAAGHQDYGILTDWHGAHGRRVARRGRIPVETSGASLSSCRRSADAACADSRQRSRRVFFDLLSELLQRRRLLGSWRHRQCGADGGPSGGGPGPSHVEGRGTTCTYRSLSAHGLLAWHMSYSFQGNGDPPEPPEDQYYGDDPRHAGRWPIVRPTRVGTCSSGGRWAVVRRRP